MWYWGVKYKKGMSEYSPLFDTRKEACIWYIKKGIYLIHMFNRKLELHEKKNT